MSEGECSNMETVADVAHVDDPSQEASHRHRPLHLTFDAFKQGCQSWLQQQQQQSAPVASPFTLHFYSYGHGWQWVTHPQVPQLSHLSRELTLVLPSQSTTQDHFNLSEDDGHPGSLSDAIADPTEYMPAERSAPRHRSVHLTQSIQYSSTWHVPVLWLQGWVSEEGGEVIRPLTMDDVLACRQDGSTLQQLLDSATNDSHKQQDAYFPPITLADHPSNGRPSVYLHPCQTAQVIGEMMHHRDENEADFGRCYLEAFLAICASAVEMRGS